MGTWTEEGRLDERGRNGDADFAQHGMPGERAHLRVGGAGAVPAFALQLWPLDIRGLDEGSPTPSPSESGVGDADRDGDAGGDSREFVDDKAAARRDGAVSDLPATAGGATLDGPPDAAIVRALAVATWPEDPATALRVLRCESSDGQHPRTYSLDAAHAGPLQIARAVWEPYFLQTRGWSWADVVGVGAGRLQTHFAAAREIYDRARGWSPWSCY